MVPRLSKFSGFQMVVLQTTLSLLNIVLALNLFSPSVEGCAAGRRKRQSASGEEKWKYEKTRSLGALRAPRPSGPLRAGFGPFGPA